MQMRKNLLGSIGTALVLLTLAAVAAGETNDTVTFAKHVAPILQRSCQNCHQPNSVAPMSLIDYEDVRPWARSIKRRIGMGPRAGVMPPWYIEKDVGIQQYQFDPSLSAEEIALIGRWVDSGAPRGDLADLPPTKPIDTGPTWTAGEPDLVSVTEEMLVKGDAADWWGDIPPVPVPITEDRYVKSIEIREINDVLDNTKDGQGRDTVGGRFVVHHMIWSTRLVKEDGSYGERTNWPVHEVGRNADVFDPEGARLLRVGSSIVSESVHLHSNGIDTKARLEIGWRFHPIGYEPKYERAIRPLGNALDIDIKAMEKDQELHAYYVLPEHTKITTFEPHLHAPGARMCLEAIWGINIQTLTCAGYDHNWVRGYEYAHGYEPLLPKGTILHIVGYMDNSVANRNVPDPRNWQGSGNRSVANMFIDLGHGVAMTDEQFQEAMNERRAMHDLNENDVVIGCPLCMVLPKTDVELAEKALTEAEAELERAQRALAAAKKASSSDREPENR